MDGWVDGWMDGILNFNQMSVQLRGFVGIFFFPVCAPLLLVGGVSSWQARKDANEREKKRDRDTSAVEIMSFLSPDPRNVRSRCFKNVIVRRVDIREQRSPRT